MSSFNVPPPAHTSNQASPNTSLDLRDLKELYDFVATSQEFQRTIKLMGTMNKLQDLFEKLNTQEPPPTERKTA
jgi:hypothetical protein